MTKLPKGNLVRTYASSGSQLAAMDVRFTEAQAKTAAIILVGAGDRRAFASQAEVIYAARDHGFRPFTGVEVFDSSKHFMMRDEPVQMVRPVDAGPPLPDRGGACGGACGGL